MFPLPLIPPILNLICHTAAFNGDIPLISPVFAPFLLLLPSFQTTTS